LQQTDEVLLKMIVLFLNVIISFYL